MTKRDSELNIAELDREVHKKIKDVNSDAVK